MAAPANGQKVAVIGLGMSYSTSLREQARGFIGLTSMMKGLAGLTTVKNLLEVGFEVTGFERSSYVGGLWHYTEDEKTSVMKSKRRLWAGIGRSLRFRASGKQ
jgi:hypothetical protein